MESFSSKIDQSIFASTEVEARKRFAKYENCDPFPEIDCSLLNSADCIDYVAAAGMIFPFYTDQIKPATCLINVLGPYTYWDKKGRKQEGILEAGKTITLKSDSILFITLEPLIQLPNYIACRFNLRIDHVYKGLLVGTGPMVDPGFVGRLSIPLHNLTSNDYIIRGGDPFVWVEFTKISKNQLWKTDDVKEKQGVIKLFNPNKRNRRLADYINDAERRPIQSSLPLSVKKAEDSARRAKTYSQVLTAINAAVVLAVLALVWNVHVQTSTFYNNSKNDLKEFQKNLHYQDSLSLIQLRNTVDSLIKQQKAQTRGKNNG